MKNILFYFFILSLFILSSSSPSCEKLGNKVNQQVADRIKLRADTFKLVDHFVDYVRLPFPYTPFDPSGDKKTYKNAWLVRFQIEGRLPSTSLATDFFIGEYRIPEYGEWKNGIYFRIYDPLLLQQLQGKEITIRRPLDKNLIHTALRFKGKALQDTTKINNEDILIGRKVGLKRAIKKRQH